MLIGAEDHPPYDRLPPSKAFLDAEGPGRVEPFHSEAGLRDELGVELLLGAPAEGLDTTAREVSVAGRAVPYDALGALTVDRPREIMKYRRHIAGRAPWPEALAFAEGTAA
ncbi:hypothetical protein [Amycolatopsis sp. NPDC051071]|uniref:hypothetical protein n=1 Tax=Amycolatopsis sp. NPDC051071 TaxID=3154637 RepID=UPI0034148B45